jgi:hypothetical protein
MIVRRLGAWSLLAVASLALFAGGPACTLEQADCACPAYGCVNAGKLTGDIALPTKATGARVKYCDQVDCLEDVLDLSQIASAPELTCVRDDGPSFSMVCFQRDAAGKVHVEATLERDGEMPPDGERYTLTIVEEASGDTLFEVAREADYEVTREDCCHRCWSAEMTL